MYYIGLKNEKFVIYGQIFKDMHNRALFIIVKLRKKLMKIEWLIIWIF